MRTPFSSADRLPRLAGMLSLILAAALAGCASKTPVIGQPARPDAAPTASESAGTQRTGPTGARRFLGIFAPYRVDVQQGNFVSREMVDQLKEAMQRPDGVTREQVRFVLGTPLLTDIFHANRWDYAFRLQKRSGEVISSRITAFFDGNRLARIEDGGLPTEQEYLALIAGAAPGAASKDESK